MYKFVFVHIGSVIFCLGNQSAGNHRLPGIGNKFTSVRHIYKVLVKLRKVAKNVSAHLRKCNARYLTIYIYRIQIGHAGDKINH